MRTILVTRPQPVADEFAEKLRRGGDRVYVAPMMEYVGLPADLGNLGEYQALVFTSAQAVKIFADLFPARNLPVLAVGDATAALATAAGFQKVYSAGGDSGDIIALIEDEAEDLFLKKILHLCSADTPENIAEGTAPLGIEVVQLPIYKARFLDEIPERVAEALRRHEIDVVTVFSVRAAENLVRIFLQKNLQDATARVDAVCISRPVAVALRKIPWRRVSVARQPKLESVMEILHGHKPGLSPPVVERRERAERRQKIAFRDAQGFIRDTAYEGPDRRTNEGRRAYEKSRQAGILAERVKFVNRSALTFAFVFIAIVLLGVFIMAPEYARLSDRPQWMTHAQEKITPLLPKTSIGSMLNSFIERIQGVTHTYSLASESGSSSSIPSFSTLLDNFEALQRDSSGGAARLSLDKLRALLGSAGGEKERLTATLEEARQKDPEMKGLLGSMKKEDLAAGAMLLILNEFRSNVNNHRPYAQDLALLRKFAGNDPAMNRSLTRLAPYAEKGIMSRKALQSEFTGLAGDILSARLQGKDVSVQEQARKRFEALVKKGSTADIRGNSAEETVARAQIMLNRGDVNGALRELQSLKGAEARAAEPWMNNAASHVIVDETSDELSQNMLQAFSGDSFAVKDIIRLLKEKVQGPDVIYLSPAFKNGPDGGKGILAPAN